MGSVFPANTPSQNHLLSHKIGHIKEDNQKKQLSHHRSLKPLTLRNRIFLNSLGIFNKEK